jgi:hypothetical protein
MKTFLKSLTSLILVFSALAPNAIASAGNDKTLTVNLRGPSVNAFFSNTDPSGCVTTEVFVSASGGTDQQLPGRGSPIGVGGVNIYKYDSCSDTVLLYAAGLNESLPAGDFQVSRQLDWASLHTTIPVTDILYGNSFDVNVDVNWTGTSDIFRDHSNTNEIYPGCHILNRWKGSGRNADASGTVSDGVTNFIPTTSQWADIDFVVSGFEIIGCQ